MTRSAWIQHLSTSCCAWLTSQCALQIAYKVVQIVGLRTLLNVNTVLFLNAEVTLTL